MAVAESDESNSDSGEEAERVRGRRSSDASLKGKQGRAKGRWEAKDRRESERGEHEEDG